MRSSRSASNGASIPPGGVATWNVSAIGVTRTPRTAKRCATAAFSDSISASAEIITRANHPIYLKIRGSQARRSHDPQQDCCPNPRGDESEARHEESLPHEASEVRADREQDNERDHNCRDRRGPEF